MTAKGYYKDIVGEKYGKLTVVKYLDHCKKVASFLCECECGNECSVRGSYLRFGKTKSCGCLNRIDIIGKKYGKLTVIEPRGLNAAEKPMYLCECDCGNKTEVNGYHLRSNNTKSCGCLKHKCQTKNMVGMKFGHLEVIELDGYNKRQNAQWKCLCHKCGETKTVHGGHLRSGSTVSCGCLIKGPTYKKYRYNGNTFRSGFELMLAMCLEFKKIDFQFEPKCFKLEIDNKIARYTPDFYLPQYDLWLETKGYTWNNSMDKYEKFSCDHKCRIIDKNDIGLLLDCSLSRFYLKWKKLEHNHDFVNEIISRNFDNLKI
jgi:hypothetical protein